jgi:hypothetical protein
MAREEEKMQVWLTTSNDRDELTQLWRWLSQDEEFRGRVRRQPGRVEPGSMGAFSDALIVEVGPAVAGLTTVLVAWLRRRGGTVEIEAKNSDGTTVTIRAEDVRGLNADQLHTLSIDMAKRLTDGRPPGPAPESEAGDSVVGQ